MLRTRKHERKNYKKKNKLTKPHKRHPKEKKNIYKMDIKNLLSFLKATTRSK